MFCRAKNFWYSFPLMTSSQNWVTQRRKHAYFHWKTAFGRRNSASHVGSTACHTLQEYHTSARTQLPKFTYFSLYFSNSNIMDYWDDVSIWYFCQKIFATLPVLIVYFFSTISEFVPFLLNYSLKVFKQLKTTEYLWILICRNVWMKTIYFTKCNYRIFTSLYFCLVFNLYTHSVQKKYQIWISTTLTKTCCSLTAWLDQNG